MGDVHTRRQMCDMYRIVCITIDRIQRLNPIGSRFAYRQGIAYLGTYGSAVIRYSAPFVLYKIRIYYLYP